MKTKRSIAAVVLLLTLAAVCFLLFLYRESQTASESHEYADPQPARNEDGENHITLVSI